MRVNFDINFLPCIDVENHSWSLYKYFTSRNTLCNEESYDLQHKKRDVVFIYGFFFIYRLLVRCCTLKLTTLISVWSGTKHFVLCSHSASNQPHSSGKPPVFLAFFLILVSSSYPL